MSSWRLLSAATEGIVSRCHVVQPLIGLAVGLKALHSIATHATLSQVLEAVDAVINESGDSSVPLSVILGIASLQALGIALSRIRFKLPDTSAAKPWFQDDILYLIFSYLDPADAAQAGLVCSHWRRNAAHASYREVTLHTSSRCSRSLAHTLLHHPHLRRRVRHLTVIHCSPYPEAHLYEWIHLLPPYALKTCRIFGISEITESIQYTYALHTACTEVVVFGYRYSEEVVLRRIALSDDPTRRRLLRKMLHAGWFVQNRVPYRSDIEAVAAPTPLPAAAEQFAKGIYLAEDDPAAMRRVDVALMDARGDLRARADAILSALDRYLGATTVMAVTMCYQEARDFAADASASSESRSGSGSGSGQRRPAAFADHKEMRRDMVNGPVERCACSATAAEREAAFPPDAVLTGAVGVVSTRFTVEAAKRVLERVWRDAMSDGRTMNLLALHFGYHGELSVPREPCATCGLWMLRTMYLPGEAPSLRLVRGAS